MKDVDYEYTGLIATYWDFLRGDTTQWPSRPYFLKIIQESGEPALDVACGTGRLLLDYLEQGIDIDGVDISPEMIALCREKVAEAGFETALYVQSMEEMAIPRRYQTIIVPSSSFLQITDRAKALMALARFREHLLPGGTLCMSLRILTADPADEEFQIISQKVRPEDGALVRRWWRCTYDMPNRLQHTEDRYEIIVDDQVVHTEFHSRSPALTWFPASEAIQMLAEAGFVDVAVYSDFTEEPATDEDHSYTIVGKK